jgi:SAM-dependent methyltransferase
MDQPTFDERKMSFGSDAATYAAFRPGFPPDAARWVLAAATRPVVDVADVGAGTGAFTRLLVDLDLRVSAYEPDPGMLAELARRLPNVPRHLASAERLPLDDASVDAVTVAQAWHWFDKPAAAAEFLRVVRPGGAIGLLWNIRDDNVGWMGAMSDIVEGGDSMRASRVDALAEIQAVHPQVERADFTHTVAMTPEEIVSLASTFSYVRLRPDSAVVYTALRDMLATHPETRGRDEIDVPYVCAAYRIPCG